MYLESAVIFSNSLLPPDDIATSNNSSDDDDDCDDRDDDDDRLSFSRSGDSLTKAVLGIVVDGSVGEVGVKDVDILHVVDGVIEVFGVVLGHVKLGHRAEEGDSDVVGIFVGGGRVDGKVCHSILDVQRLVVREGLVLDVAVTVGLVQLESKN